MHPFGPQRLECCESLLLIVAKEVPIQGSEVQFWGPTMHSSNQDASLSKSVM